MASTTLDRHSVARMTQSENHATPGVNDVCLVSTTEQRWFRSPVAVYSTHELHEVVSILNQIDLRVTGESLYAAGFIAFEASPAFDPSLRTRESGDTPLLWFGLYDSFETSIPDPSNTPSEFPKWIASVNEEEFTQSIHRIREYIAAGDTYQVNYTFPLHAQFNGDPYAWYRALCEAQCADYCAYINTGTEIVVSASPELFFKLDRNLLTTKPMKGTIARGVTLDDDLIQRERLKTSAKDRAENLMIVDLMRNDMGRISEVGSVKVESMFDVARFDTLWQMTSTVKSKTDASIPEILGALFPSGSVTGAPKIRTTEIIQELEREPRGVYCGSIGWWGPDRTAEFNVAIRTATIDIEQKTMRYPVGAGITWDSSAFAEYAECLLKAEVVSEPKPTFSLLESLLWDGEFFLVDRHLNRLEQSAEYFGFVFDREKVLEDLKCAISAHDTAHLKVRLLLDRIGEVTIDIAPVGQANPSRITLATEPVDTRNMFLYHKTTHRNVYEAARAGSSADDVILWNERGEITESSRANVVVKRNGRWVTPLVECGLLGGTYRAQLLEDGIIEEGVVTKGEFIEAVEVCLINSVRRWIPTERLLETGTDQK